MLIGFNKNILCNVIRRMCVFGNDVSIIPYVFSVGFHKLPYVRYAQLCRKLQLHFLQALLLPPYSNRLPKEGESSQNRLIDFT